MHIISWINNRPVKEQLRQNIWVTGQTGSGKTLLLTTLKALKVELEPDTAFTGSIDVAYDILRDRMVHGVRNGRSFLLMLDDFNRHFISKDDLKHLKTIVNVGYQYNIFVWGASQCSSVNTLGIASYADSHFHHVKL